MTIYTKQGDRGETSLLGNFRLPKSSSVFEILGTLDEVNALIGIINSSKVLTLDAKNYFLKIQHLLFDIGSIIAGKTPSKHSSKYLEKMITDLENQIDSIEAVLPTLTKFILPGGSKLAGEVHYLRTVVRRLERHFVGFQEDSKILSPWVKSYYIQTAKYLNRLSDFLFVFARFINFQLGYEDIFWDSSSFTRHG